MIDRRRQILKTELRRDGFGPVPKMKDLADKGEIINSMLRAMDIAERVTNGTEAKDQQLGSGK